MLWHQRRKLPQPRHDALGANQVRPKDEAALRVVVVEGGEGSNAEGRTKNVVVEYPTSMVRGAVATLRFRTIHTRCTYPSSVLIIIPYPPPQPSPASASIVLLSRFTYYFPLPPLSCRPHLDRREPHGHDRRHVHIRRLVDDTLRDHPAPLVHHCARGRAGGQVGRTGWESKSDLLEYRDNEPGAQYAVAFTGR